MTSAFTDRFRGVQPWHTRRTATLPWRIANLFQSCRRTVTKEVWPWRNHRRGRPPWLMPHSRQACRTRPSPVCWGTTAPCGTRHGPRRCARSRNSIIAAIPPGGPSPPGAIGPEESPRTPPSTALPPRRRNSGFPSRRRRSAAAASRRRPGAMADQRLGARSATRHLLAAGHRAIWHLGGCEKWLEAEGRVTLRTGNCSGRRAGVWPRS
jgi:hypothetical protein